MAELKYASMVMWSTSKIDTSYVLCRWERRIFGCFLPQTRSCINLFLSFVTRQMDSFCRSYPPPYFQFFFPSLSWRLGFIFWYHAMQQEVTVPIFAGLGWSVRSTYTRRPTQMEICSHELSRLHVEGCPVALPLSAKFFSTRCAYVNYVLYYLMTRCN